jgi:glucose/mannose-6-phosphate isomerase
LNSTFDSITITKMKELIEKFPNNISNAFEIAKKYTFKLPSVQIKNIVICGMGGSGIGGKIVSQWIQDDCHVPITIVQDYSLPKFVNEHTLVIGSSYSGNTEETLFALEEAHSRKCFILGICSGGLLESFCKKHNYDCVLVPGGNPPRTALAFSLVQLSNIMAVFGFSNDGLLSEIEAGRTLILEQAESIISEAKKIAQTLIGKTIGIYSSAEYDGVGIRAKQQFNENAKVLCWQHVIPEMNHNELVGWGDGTDEFGAFFIQSGDLSIRNQRRFDISVDVIKSKSKTVVIAEAKGNTRVEKSIYLIHLVDWISYEWSVLKNGDPIEIKVIDFLKSELGKIN